MFKQAGFAFIAFLSFSPTAMAQTAQAPAVAPGGCAPPKLMNSLPMEQLPGSELRTITATIDGNPQKLLIDIGRRSTQLWDATASKLKLAVLAHGAGRWDFAGRYSEGFARIGSITIGSIESGGIHFQISTDPDAAPAPVDGILRNDAMAQYDIDLDFAHQRMNYFTPEQCTGAGIYWSPTTVTAVPILAYTGTQYGDRSPIARFGTTYVPVTLDGHVILALLDTSLDRTFLNPDVAKKVFGLSAETLDAGNVSDGGALIKAGVHRFSTLTLGGLTASNPLVAIPFDVKTQSSGITHIAKTARSSFLLHEIMPDIVVGMDMLKHTHLYVAFQSDQVYVSAAGEGTALTPGPIATSRLKEF